MRPRSAQRAEDAAVRPILKWAGGKRQLLPQLRPYYPAHFTRYVEPFLGSGAVFLDCYNQGLLDGRDVRLSDINADIIGCYRMVRDAVDDTIALLAALEDGHHRGGQQHFYEIRDAGFNRLREAAESSGDPAGHYTPELAAMLIYLNRTGYNGLFRLNSRGAFNVPAGRYASPRICDRENLRRLSAALARPDLSLDVEPFDRALEVARPADFIYLDPPYAPVSATARFTSYTAAGFGAEQQARLQRAVVRLADAGAWIVLSNSDAPDIRRLYAESSDARRVGLRAHKVTARRAINSRATHRGAVKEYLITNVR